MDDDSSPHADLLTRNPGKFHLRYSYTFPCPFKSVSWWVKADGRCGSSGPAFIPQMKELEGGFLHVRASQSFPSALDKQVALCRSHFHHSSCCWHQTAHWEPRNTTSKNKTKPHKKAELMLFSLAMRWFCMCCQIFCTIFGWLLTVSFSLPRLPLAVVAEESMLKGNRKQTVPQSVYIPGRAVPLHDDLLTQDPPEPGPAKINAPREQSVGAGEILLGKESVCVCSSFVSKAVKTAPKCQVACQYASLCHPSLNQTKATSELCTVARRIEKWWFVINGKELSDSAGKKTASGTLTWGWKWGANVSSLMWELLGWIKTLNDIWWMCDSWLTF